MTEIQDNKKFDFKILFKLLHYAKPYSLLIALSVFLLCLITFLELLQPVLIGTVIDKFINGYKTPYAYSYTEIKDAVKYRNIFLSKNYQFIKDPSFPKAQIIYTSNKYFIFTGLDNNAANQINKYNFNRTGKNSGEISANIAGKKYTGILLTRDDLKSVRQNDFNNIILYALIFFALIILLFTFTYFESLINQYTGQKAILKIRYDLYRHITKLSFRFFDKNPIGKLVTRVTNDTENVNEMYTEVLANFFKNIFLITGIVIMMFVINVKLTLISFAVLPFVFALIFLYRKFALTNYRTLRKILAEFNAFLSEHITGMKIIQLFGIEKKIFDKCDKVTKGSFKAHLTEITIFAVFRPSMFLSYIIAVCAVLLFGGNSVINSLLSVGTLFIFIQYVGRFFEPVQELAEKFNIFQSAMVSAERIFNLLDEKNDVPEAAKPVSLKKIEGNIIFKNVWFAYNNEDWVLKNISFEINKGQTTAFVGTTGSGKTSILNVLCRYYDFQKGEITVDGIDIRKLSADDLRSRIGLVMQDVFIFTGSVADNIRLRDGGIDMGRIENAAEFVNASRFIENLGQKYEHQMSERGTTISTGQRQLLSFARAIVTDPDILMLDEATSNIDTETEEFIQNALAKMLKEKTSIVIAHRLSTIKNADNIIVLHHGKIVESGRHKKLLKQKGFYYKLYKMTER